MVNPNSSIIHQKTKEAYTNHSPRAAHKYSIMRKKDKKIVELILHKHDLSFYNEGVLAFLYEVTLVI